VQLKAKVSRDLKRPAFSILALREQKFNGWLRTQLTALVREVEAAEEKQRDAQMVRSEKRV
jgi:hypothetical protein